MERNTVTDCLPCSLKYVLIEVVQKVSCQQNVETLGNRKCRVEDVREDPPE